MKDGTPIDSSHGTANVQHEDELPHEHSESADPEDFDFDDELNLQDSVEAYMFVQQATYRPYVEDMQGNPRYCLNMKSDRNGVQSRLDNYWLLLDNQSTVHIFCNPKLLTNIRKSERHLTLHTNSGTAIIDQEGDFPGVGKVWFYAEGIANILSFHKLERANKFEMDYSTRPNQDGIRDSAFRVETPDGVQRRFLPDGNGLYFLDCTEFYGTNKPNSVFTNPSVSTHKSMSFAELAEEQADAAIATIEDNKSKFTQRDVKRADMIRRFQHVAAHASDETIRLAVANCAIINLPITPRDIRIANAIYGPSVYALQGKRTHRRKDTVNTDANIPVPKNVIDFYQDITLSADIIHVNQIPFLATISRHIHYGTISPLVSMKIPHLENALLGVIRSYGHRGFSVRHLMVDMQFEPLKSHFKDEIIDVNATSFAEHSPEIERYNRTIKERARATFAMLPFERIPKKMLVALLEHVVFYLNAFPWTGGVSPKLSPLTIIEGLPLDYQKHFPVIFGEYAQVYTGTNNSMDSRMVGAIALGPTRNLQGGARFLNLLTGDILTRHRADFTLLPVPADAITRVHRLACKTRSGLRFGDRMDNPFANDTDDESDDDYVPPDADTDIVLAPPDLDDDASHQQTDSSTGVDDDESSQDPDSTSQEHEDFDSDDASESGESDDDSTPGVEIPGVGIPGVETVTEDEDQADATEPVQTSSGRTIKSTQNDDFVYTSWGNMAKHHIFGDTELQMMHQEDSDQTAEKVRRVQNDEYERFVQSLNYIERAQQHHDFINDYTMAQLNIKEGLKEFGVDGKASLMKEIKNLVDRDCFGEVDYDSLTSQQKRDALPILMFMVRKRDGRIKSRGCADGRRQRLWTEKQEVSSPTPAVEALKYILSMISLEGRDVASFDLPAQFLQTDMDELLHLKITGALALLLVESDPKRWKMLKFRINPNPNRAGEISGLFTSD